jgi:ABC-type glutathione transport system ATPase component
MPSSLPIPASQSDALLKVEALCKGYVRGGLWGKRRPVAAVTQVDFEVKAGQTLALIGASGSGKSTVARCISRIERPDSGQIWIQGTDIAQLGRRPLLPFRAQVQMIFQDAATAMNPRFTAADVIDEPLRIQGRSRAEREHLSELLMREVALSPEWLNRPVTNFSGGQRQRLAIARALSLRPKLLILDEALSGLDLSTQAQIANLLLDLQAAYSLSYLLISHDLTLVARMADMVAVMSEGRIVESGSTQLLVSDPKHSETQRLLASANVAKTQPALSRGASA